MNPKSRVSVVLISPPDERLIKYTKEEKLLIDPPLGLAYLAAYLREKGITVEILDANAQEFSKEEVVKWVKSQNPRIVGFTVFTHMVTVVADITGKIKKELPSLKIICGGPHIHICYKEFLESFPQIDFTIRGEGEITLLELVEALSGKRDLDSVKGISYRVAGQVISNEKREYISDLDELPFPARNLLPMELYSAPQVLGGVSPYTTFMFSRGCPFRCQYCISPVVWGRQRGRTVQNAVDEIEYVYSRYKIKAMRFEDDTFTVNKNWAKGICQEIIDRGLNHIKWEANTRVGTLDYELLSLMKKAGCISLALGIEFGNQRILDLCQKGFSVTRVRETVQLIKKAGMWVKGYFMLGYPTETEKTILDTIKLSQKAGLDYAVFSLVTPFPGTPLFDYANEKGLLVTEDWNDYQFGYTGRRPLRLDTVSEKRLIELYHKAIKGFWYRPSQIVKILKRHPKFALSFVRQNIFRQFRKIDLRGAK